MVSSNSFKPQFYYSEERVARSSNILLLQQMSNEATNKLSSSCTHDPDLVLTIYQPSTVHFNNNQIKSHLKQKLEP